MSTFTCAGDLLVVDRRECCVGQSTLASDGVDASATRISLAVKLPSEVGFLSPYDFKVKDADGHGVALSDYRGKDSHYAGSNCEASRPVSQR